MPPKNQVKQSWQKSDGKELLMADLRSGTIALRGKGDADKIYKLRAEFGGDDIDDKRKFPHRLRTARLKTEMLNNLSDFDVVAISHDRAIFPIKVANHETEPRWDGSQAQVLLRNDVSAKLHHNMKPQELHRLRTEYSEFSLTKFREHIYQEERRQKYIKDKYSRNRKA